LTAKHNHAGRAKSIADRRYGRWVQISISLTFRKSDLLKNQETMRKTTNFKVPARYFKVKESF